MLRRCLWFGVTPPIRLDFFSGTEAIVLDLLRQASYATFMDQPQGTSDDSATVTSVPSSAPTTTDTPSINTTPPTPNDGVVPVVTPWQASQQRPAFSGDGAAVTGDTTAVPKESVGFAQVEAASGASASIPSVPPASPTSPASSPPILPVPPVQPQPVVQRPSPQPQPSPAAPVSPPPAVAARPGTPPAAGSDKSPLEILEEILAEANSEKSKAAEAEKAKEEEEKKFEAEMAAKEAAFRQEAEVQLTQTKLELEEAKTHRQEVEQELTAQGKGNDQAPTPTDDALVIRQLEHDKVQQTE